MCVLIEGISVVVKARSLEEKYTGGVAAYAATCPNDTYCADRDLVRIGFMSPYDVQRWVTDLEQQGLIFVQERQCVDVAVVDQVSGPTAPCDWLEFGRQPEGYTVAWLTGTEPHEVEVPEGWTEAQSLSDSHRRLTFDQMKRELFYLRREGDTDVFADQKTGKDVYMGRIGWKD